MQSSGNTIIGNRNQIDSFNFDSAIVASNDAYLGTSGSGNTIVGGSRGTIISANTNSSIFGGIGNYIPSGLTNTTIIGSSGLTATTSYLTYVDNIYITESINLIPISAYTANTQIWSAGTSPGSIISIGTGGNVLGINTTESIIAGGYTNRIISGSRSSLVGGTNNTINGSGYASIVGGVSCYISNGSDGSVILGGVLSTCNSSNYSSILGGGDNNIYSSSYSSISGGLKNYNQNTYSSSIIGGGYNVQYKCHLSSIVGGKNNNNNSYSSCIISSFNSTQSYSRYSSIIGGYGNNLKGTSPNQSIGSSVVGGQTNHMYQSNYSSIIGGGANTMSGVSNSAIICCSGFTSPISNTVYVPNLVVLGTSNIAANTSYIFQSNGIETTSLTETILFSGKIPAGTFYKTGSTFDMRTILNAGGTTGTFNIYVGLNGNTSDTLTFSATTSSANNQPLEYSLFIDSLSSFYWFSNPGNTLVPGTASVSLDITTTNSTAVNWTTNDYFVTITAYCSILLSQAQFDLLTATVTQGS